MFKLKNALMVLLAFNLYGHAAHARLFDPVAEGGDRVGNGGDVVVCGDKVQLLDIYETTLRGNKLFPIEENDPYKMVASLLEAKVKKLQPTRYLRYKAYLEAFEEEAEFLPGIQLNDVDDAGLVVIPSGCQLQQVAIQLSESERRPGDKRYVVNADLWNKLSSYDKMSLIFHEILFREQRDYGRRNSMIVRGLLGQYVREKTDIGAILLLYEKVGLKHYDSHLALEIFGLSYYGALESAKVEGSKLSLKFSNISYHVYKINDVNYELSSQNQFVFDTEKGILIETHGSRNSCKWLDPGIEFKISNLIISASEKFLSCGAYTSIKNGNKNLEFDVKTKKFEATLKNVEELRTLDSGIYGNFSIQAKNFKSIASNAFTVGENRVAGGALDFESPRGSYLVYEINFLENSYELRKARLKDYVFKSGNYVFNLSSDEANIELDQNGVVNKISGDNIKFGNTTSFNTRVGFKKIELSVVKGRGYNVEINPQTEKISILGITGYINKGYESMIYDIVITKGNVDFFKRY